MTTENIETLDDWNARMVCCCSMPACPAPTIKAESITATKCGFAFPEFDGITDEQRDARYEGLTITEVSSRTGDWDYFGDFNLTRIVGSSNESHNRKTSLKKSDKTGICKSDRESASWSGSRSFNEVIKSASTGEQLGSSSSQTTWSSSDPGNGDELVITKTESVTVNGVTTSTTTQSGWRGFDEGTYEDECEFKGGDVFSITITNSWSNPPGSSDIDNGQTSTTATRTYSGKVDLRNLMEKKKFSDGAVETSYAESEIAGLHGTKTRIKHVIPAEHQGNYFKITWDWLTEPDGWDSGEENSPKRTLADGGTWVWGGPGSQSDPEGPSWQSPWFDIPLPKSGKGKVRLVNLRYECYAGPYGHKPQVTGEAIDESEL